jgi:hypothetical protein
VTPARPTVTGRAAAARPLLLLLLSLTTLGACIGEASTTLSPSVAAPSASTPQVSPTTQMTSPSSSPGEIATESPESPEPIESPSIEPTATLTPEEAVAACAGNDDNRTFFLDASKELDWPVYCPVLPARWVVSSGSYSGRGVGQLEIAYRGPAGATLSFQQGGFCETSDGCVPAGTDTGDAAFGDQSGTLVTLDDGGYAIVVGRADTPSWLVVATGIDEPTFRAFGEAFVRLD